MTVHLLGTGAPFPNAHRTTTMLAVESAGRLVLVDCGGDVMHRLLACGLDVDAVDALVLTHEHADHVGGFATMMVKLWLSGRTRPLPVVGFAEALGQARRVWETYDTASQPGLFPLDWREVPREAGALVYTSDTLRVTGSPVVHGPPTLGLRFEESVSGARRVVAYSCDTEPCDAVADLARGADLLVHEASGEGTGHSSARQATEIAARTGAARCVLVHLPPGIVDADLNDARAVFADVRLGADGDRIDV